MAPLAGKPPFATDEPDSFYETPRAPQPRVRQPAPPNPNSRTSAYDVYENYLADDKTKLLVPVDSSAASNRNSGIGALLLNMGDDSDSDDDEDIRRKPTSPSGIAPLSKNAALAAATGVTNPISPNRPSPPPQARQPQQSEQRLPQPMSSPNKGPPPPQNRGFPLNLAQQPPPHIQQQQQVMRGPMPPPHQQPRPIGPPQPQQQMYNSPHPPNQRPPPGPQPIAAPQPGYAAPIAALNLARPEAAAAPGGRQRGVPHPMKTQNPFEPPFAGPGRAPASPALSTPHPLLPPVTPITPAFIRPASKSPTPVNVSFKEGVATPRKPIMRGNSEETLLPSRGEKGDDFWRRFSMVAKEDSRKKESSWLKKTRDGSARHSLWVWIVGIFLLLCIGGGIGLGVYMSRKSPSHQTPVVIGGSANYTAGPSSPPVAPTKSGGPRPSSSRLHVSPTNTVARRLAEDAPLTPAPMPTSALVPRMHAKRRLGAHDVW